MSGQEIATQVMAIVSEKFGKSPDSIAENASFTQDLGADSLDIAELVMTLEEKFDITISDEDAPKIQTVKNAIDYIVSKKQ